MVSIRTPGHNQWVVSPSAAYVCYLLASSTHPQRSYVGITNRFDRRIRQHNGELKGGAKATRIGRPWHPWVVVEGFPDRTTSLQFEWMWKNTAPKRSHGKRARIRKLRDLLGKERWTTNAPPAATIALTVTVYDWQLQQQQQQQQQPLPTPPNSSDDDNSDGDFLLLASCWEFDLLTNASRDETAAVLPDYVSIRHVLVAAGDDEIVGGNETD